MHDAGNAAPLEHDARRHRLRQAHRLERHVARRARHRPADLLGELRLLRRAPPRFACDARASLGGTKAPSRRASRGNGMKISASRASHRHAHRLDAPARGGGRRPARTYAAGGGSSAIAPCFTNSLRKVSTSARQASGVTSNSCCKLRADRVDVLRRLDQLPDARADLAEADIIALLGAHHHELVAHFRAPASRLAFAPS